jgi:hypothetical protein
MVKKMNFTEVKKGTEIGASLYRPYKAKISEIAQDNMAKIPGIKMRWRKPRSFVHKHAKISGNAL